MRSPFKVLEFQVVLFVALPLVMGSLLTLDIVVVGFLVGLHLQTMRIKNCNHNYQAGGWEYVHDKDRSST